MRPLHRAAVYLGLADDDPPYTITEYPAQSLAYLMPEDVASLEGEPMPARPETLSRLITRLTNVLHGNANVSWSARFADLMLDDPQAIIDVMFEFELLNKTGDDPLAFWRVAPKPHVHDYNVELIYWSLPTGDGVPLAKLRCFCGETISDVPIDANRLLA